MEKLFDFLHFDGITHLWTRIVEYVAGVIAGLAKASSTVTSADGHVSVTYKEENGVVTVESVGTSDIASAGGLSNLAGLVGGTALGEGESDLKTRIGVAEGAINLLNGATAVEGSVDNKIDKAFNDFATKMSDDNVVNTFKELVDYVAAHGTEYTNLAALVGTLPVGAGVTTVVAYIEALIAAEKTRAEAAEKALDDAIKAFKPLTNDEIDAAIAAASPKAE